MVRAGKFKTKRGGGRNFSRDLEGAEGEDAFDKWARKGKGAETDSDEDSSEEESGSGSGSGSGSEESSSEEDEPVAAPQAVGITADPKKAALFGNTVPEVSETSRADRKAAKKGKKVVKKQESESDSDEDLKDLKGMGNLNVDKKGKPIAAGSDAQGLNRKEREAEEKKAAAERYRALHAAGKTDQSKNDMARLQRIRKEREEAAAKRVAEAALVKEAAEAKKAQQKLRG